jgi:transcriptional regulator with XRE-family HTH domain
MDRPEVIAARLKALRRAMGFDQASKWCAFVEIPENSWAHFEHGRRPITVEAAVRVADKCGTSLDWIYRGNGQGPLGIDPSGGVAAAPVEDQAEDLSTNGDTPIVAEMKQLLAHSLGVPLSRIKITITIEA